MKYFTKSLMLYLLCICVHAQEFRVEHIGVNDGMSQGSPYHILKDSRGFMWFGTQDGINRYDGHTFKIYKSDINDPHGLHGVNIAGLVEDHNGNIWVGTEEGLNCYERTTDHFRLVTKDSQTHTKKRTSPFFADENELWYIREGEGILAYNFKTQSHRIVAPIAYITQDFDYIDWTTKTAKGDIWMLKPKGLVQYSTTEQKYYHYFSDTPNNIVGPPLNIYCIYIDNKNIIWLGTSHGLLRFDPIYKEFRFFEKSPNGQSLGSVYSLASSQDNILWVGTQRNGIWKFDTKHEILFSANLPSSTRRPLDNYEIVRIYIDDRGIVWANTDPDGLLKIIPNAPTFQKLTDISYLPDSKRFINYSVRCLGQDGNGNIWVGTEGELLVLDKKNSTIKGRFLSNASLSNIPAHNNLRFIFKDSHQQMWVGTFGGIYKFDSISKQFRLIQFDKDPTKSVYVRNIIELPDGLFLIGTPEGAFIFNPKNESFSKAPILNGKNVFASFIASDGTIWLSAYFDGLYGFKYENRSWRVVFHGLTSFNINLIREDTRRNIFWIATEKGLVAYQPKSQKYVFYSTKNGLANSYIYCIELDKASNLWMSTNRGITKFEPQKQLFRNFDLSDGIQGYEYNGNAGFKDFDGRIWFGGINGLNSFYPEQITNMSFKPPVHFYNFKVNEKPYITSKHINELGEISLPFSENTFSIEFSAIDFYSNGHNYYQYKLEGQDNNWVKSGDRNYVRYPNLAAGHYTFKVKAANRDGVWSDTEKTLKIYIRPPFWQTWWFYVFCSGGIGYIAFAWGRNRLSLLRKKEQERLKIALDAQEQERKQIAQDLHDEIGARLATLKLYATSMTQFLSKEGLDMKAKTMEIINDSIIDIRRMLRELSPRIVENYGYAAGLDELTSKIKQSGQIEIEIDTSRMPERLPHHIEIGLYRITQELLNNTLKHGQAKKITIRVHKENMNISLDYFDNGIGFDYHKAKQGLGIGNIESRVTLLKGSIIWQPKTGEGNAVFIQIPA